GRFGHLRIAGAGRDLIRCGDRIRLGFASRLAQSGIDDGAGADENEKQDEGQFHAQPSRRESTSSSTALRSGDQIAVFETMRLASLLSITPSSRTRNPLAARVEPVDVMSTTTSATPDAGAASVAPRLSTIRYSAMPALAKCWRVMVTYLVA